ncbi:branched-chain amino acid transport [Gottschalkia purinilytica]|uniref:Branched-chain amino acid transport n=1 Tax=Gottschalkia purinilytica TaxID=1503 RepID=A0A0L0WB96_GOTPU|nr:AzlD domain-containing protein [Gottschalkia purinilytica]KNF08610.1 branched-chain amino acid transport [Gottschalkia purinilytica]
MTKTFIYILIMCIVTYIPRVIPIVLMKREINSKFLKSFLYYVPFAVLGAMTFPAIIYSTNNIYTGIAGTLVAIILAYFNKGLMSVAVFSVLIVYILGFAI